MIANLVNEKVLASGTGDILLNGATDSFTTVSSAFSNGDTLFYSVADGNYRENGIGTYNGPGNRIVRTKVFELIDSGGYASNPVGVLNISANATIAVSPSTQALTTHIPSWTRVYGQTFLLGGTNPGISNIVGTVSGYAFDPSTAESIGATIQIGHNIVGPTDITLGIKWSPTDTSTGVVRWGIEYSTAKVGDSLASTTTIYLEQAPNATADEIMLVEAGVTISVDEPNTVIQARVFRDATHGNDTYTQDAIFIGVEAAYLSQCVGTPKQNSPHNSWA